jgi:hypothetical protein
MPVEILPVPILISGVVLGVVLLLMGLSRRDKKLIGWGEILIGLSVFALPMMFFLYKASDAWETFVPSTGELTMFGVLTFAAGMSVALGLRNILTLEGAPKSSSP